LQTAPNLFLIGASKCGTTLLHDMLAQHPDIFMSQPKELWHFNHPDHQTRSDAYLSFFRKGAGFKVRGESTPIYSETLTFPHVPGALATFSPGAKIIYLVREPFARFKSQWRQTLDSGHWAKTGFYDKKMPTSYRDAVFRHPPFLLASMYWTNISTYMQHFPASAIKVLLFEDFAANPRSVCRDVFRFLEVDEGFVPDLERSRQNSSDGKSVYSPLVSAFRRAVPPRLRGALPKRLRHRVRDRIINATAPQFDHAALSEEDEMEIRRILLPEVTQLYRFLGITTDPWRFLPSTEK
jgi:hypothetical protein